MQEFHSEKSRGWSEKSDSEEFKRKEAEKKAYYLKFARSLARENADFLPQVRYSIHWRYSSSC